MAMFGLGAALGAIGGALFGRGGGGGGNDNSAQYSHEQAMQNARQDHQRVMDEANKAHEISMMREQAAANARAQELANAASKIEQDAVTARLEEKNEHIKQMEKLQHAENEKQRTFKEAADKRQKQHEKDLEELEKQKLKIKQDIEAQEQKHKEDMKQMWIDAKERDRENKEKQRDDALKNVQRAIENYESQSKKAGERKIEFKELHEKILQNIKIQDHKIKNFDKEEEIKEEKKEMEDALKKWSDNDKEIKSAIDKTQIHEDNIGRFLKLTHALIGETVESQAQANKLDVELHTFSTLISRECQDKLEIIKLFEERTLSRFTPLMAKQNYLECQDLICEDEEEFKEDILYPLQEEIGKEIKEWKKRHPNEDDVWDVFLEKYKLKKYKQGLENAGLDGFEEIGDLETDEDMDGVIDEAGITGLFKKKFKRAINDYKTGKYKPIDKDAEDKPMDVAASKEDEKEQKEDKKPQDMNIEEYLP